MSLFENRLRVRSAATTLGEFLSLHKDNELYLDADYQRPYVWTADHRQALLRSIFNNQPIDSVSVVYNPRTPNRYCEVVDGKQRITSLVMYHNGEFSYTDHDGAQYYFEDLCKPDKIGFRQTRLTSNELMSFNEEPVSEKDKLEYFLQKNFGGVAQSDEHKKLVEGMYLEATGNKAQSAKSGA